MLFVKFILPQIMRQCCKTIVGRGFSLAFQPVRKQILFCKPCPKKSKNKFFFLTKKIINDKNSHFLIQKDYG